MYQREGLNLQQPKAAAALPIELQHHAPRPRHPEDNPAPPSLYIGQGGYLHRAQQHQYIPSDGVEPPRQPRKRYTCFRPLHTSCRIPTSIDGMEKGRRLSVSLLSTLSFYHVWNYDNYDFSSSIPSFRSTCRSTSKMCGSEYAMPYAISRTERPSM